MIIETLETVIKADTGGAIENINAFKDAVKGVATQMPKLRAATETASGGFNKFIRSIGRVAFYRAIRTAIKEVTQSFQEGLTNAYEYSQMVGFRLADSLDRVASKGLTLKNQLGSLWGEVQMAIEPVLIQIATWAIKAADAISQFFAALGGQATYLKAEETATSWNDATKAAKAYKNTLLGFDEINRLNDVPSGGAGSAANVGEMFEVAEVSDKIKEIAGYFKDMDLATAGVTAGFSLLVSNLFPRLMPMAGAVVFTVSGIKLEYSAVKDIVLNGATKENITKAVLGGVATAIGGTIIGGIVGATGIGAAIGVTLALGVGFKAYYDAKKEEFDKSALGERLKKLQADIQATIDENERIRLVIRSSLDVLGGTDWDVAYQSAKSLVEELFELESLDIKTPEDINRIQLLVDALNNIGFGTLIDGFDRVTGAVNADKDAVLDLIETRYRLYMQEAYKESYIEALKASYDAFVNLKKATEDATAAGEVHTEFLDELYAKQDEITEAQNRQNEAIRHLDLSAFWDATKDVKALSDEYDILSAKTIEANTAAKEAKVVQDEAQAVYDEARDAVKRLETAYVDFANGVDGSMTNAKNSVKTNVAGMKSALDGLSAYSNAKLKAVTENNPLEWLGSGKTPGKYATGGSPTTGSLFIAGENGAEIISSQNGRTNVSNANQIADAVESGNGSVVNAVLAIGSMITKAVNDKDSNFYVSGRQLAQELYPYNQQINRNKGNALVQRG